ncbi:Glutathione-regulated potassium-efflux system ancillary protein KefF [Agrobacterium sp. DSM 25558]|uniref:NAD(P)H-dependent oxidoreductase n=1 Tax=Agrobacterium sp. DSM 25558 TaxID=1907665 RepID=UPI0009725C46|nr:NAD(P)H-dependent oxidoreductase [Agrobacterium sp. DSM 25558]SCX29203.1 Glutathione-regulated potassium-efflux system ancillary protein KefF [Agrobacterium sp. DSM 25558]
MHILIVTAHPDPASYTHGAVARLVDGLDSLPGTTHEVLNLASSGFDPRFAGPDNDLFHGRGQMPVDIREEQRRIDRADALVLVFPVYWWSMPAVMKGWIDRVFIQGWAFIDDGEKEMKRLLVHLKGQVVAIGGADYDTYQRRGYFDALNAQIVQGIFGYCGMPVIGLDLLLPVDRTGVEDGLQRAFDIGRRVAGA